MTRLRIHCDNPDASEQPCSSSYPVYVRLANAPCAAALSSSTLPWSAGCALHSLSQASPGPHQGSVVWRESGPEVVIVSTSPRNLDSPGYSDVSPAESPTSVLSTGQASGSISRCTSVQVRSIHRTGSELRLSYFLKENMRTEAGNFQMGAAPGLSQLRKSLVHGVRGDDKRTLLRTRSAEAASMSLDFLSEEDAEAAERMLLDEDFRPPAGNGPRAPRYPGTSGDSFGSMSSSPQRSARPIVRTQSLPSMQRIPSQTRHGHNLALATEGAYPTVVAICFGLFALSAVVVVSFVMTAVYFLLKRPIGAAKKMIKRVRNTDGSNVVGNAKLLCNVLQQVGALDPNMDTETGSVTDASEDTEMWRGTHDGQQDHITTPRSMLSAREAAVPPSEGLFSSKIARRVAFIEQQSTSAASAVPQSPADSHLVRSPRQEPTTPTTTPAESEALCAESSGSSGGSLQDSASSMSYYSSSPARMDTLAKLSGDTDALGDHEDPAMRARKHAARYLLDRAPQPALLSDEPSWAGPQNPIRPFRDGWRIQDFKQYWVDNHGLAEDVVQRFINGHNDGLGTAKEGCYNALKANVEFRCTNRVHNILRQEQPHFVDYKEMFTHTTVGLAKDGSPIWKIMVGEIEEGYEKYKEAGADKEAVDRHICFCQDFLYHVVHPRLLPSGKCYWILDLKGLKYSSLVNLSAVYFGIELMFILEKHYPERLQIAFAVNCPAIFPIFWRIVKPLLPAATRNRLCIMKNQKQYVEEMSKHIDMDVIPEEYGGRGVVTGRYHALEEVALRMLAERNNASFERQRELAQYS